MEFLEKLYSNELFPPILFIIIAVLAVAFIIVLILALKDAKKNKNMADNGTPVENAFAQQEQAPTAVNVQAEPSVAPIQDLNQEKPVEAPVNVIESVQPVSNTFENVNVEAPIVEPAIAQPIGEVTVEQPTEEPVINPVSPVAPVVPQVESPDIKIEVSPVATQEDVNRAESDLDQIAATLLKEYQKETPEAVNPIKEEVSPVVQPNEQISPVFVSPDTLPSKVEETSAGVPSFNDIPTPQPVRVTNTSTVIDSSNQSINNIATEEYNISK